jgi:hypothetical protein
MATFLFKDGDSMGIQTDCADEHDFNDEFAQVLGQLVESGNFTGDWYFQLTHWLPQFAELIAGYRGYKAADVKKSTIMSVGNVDVKDLVRGQTNGRNNRPKMDGFAEHVERVEGGTV